MTDVKMAFNASCLNCGLQKICFPTGLSKTEMDKLDDIVQRKAPLQKNQMLFSAGDKFTSLFAIRAGVIKVYSFSDGGEEIIHGFYLPGDVVGIDALASKVYMFNAMALDSTSVCAVPFDELSDLSQKIPHLNQQVFNIMSKEVVEGRLHSELLTKKNADQRIAQFIWSMAERFKSRGYHYLEFRLSILHRDVAVYLGLTPETVSRILAKLHQDNVVTWKKKELQIHDEVALRTLAGSHFCDSNSSVKAV
ncbi:fumarate/nitrate reduction transcriptional regulator Fnr [Thiomicrorhabdus sp. ZW0627]|uniref:fumarate/nitrate reduction transcriptional regulator Fnr n=1 Tax=Thiomicrorhabdus sp. ZW0627 TaxID=3039774 RepID=UPI0024374524|nr:fumarate/nitrate reduction transcriptional regulator Fnr [Thiomicrorhabdus sp. ZW0627]MDG6773392.1 fumarate/nitrate reduction transcriptional regulator Fnr [Thiomicrorhabdus sp. ZW0627]